MEGKTYFVRQFLECVSQSLATVNHVCFGASDAIGVVCVALQDLVAALDCNDNLVRRRPVDPSWSMHACPALVDSSHSPYPLAHVQLQAHGMSCVGRWNIHSRTQIQTHEVSYGMRRTALQTNSSA